MKKPIRLMLALLAVFSLFAAACGSDSADEVVDSVEDAVEDTGDAAEDAVDTDEDAMEDEDAMDEDAMEDEDHSDTLGAYGPGCAAVPEDGDGSFAGMADDPAGTAASNNPALSILVDAVVAADLVDTLNSDGPFTIFAPANSAFEAVPADILDAVLADQDLLTAVLTYHVIGGQSLSADDLAGGTFETVETGSVELGPDGETVNDASVVCSNVVVANGTVHIIDSVLLPQVALDAIAALGGDEAAADAPGATDVGLVYDIGGRGDLSFNDSAAAGLERAADELGWETTEASPNEDGSNRAELLQLAADANDMVLAVGFLFAGDAADAALANPDTNFAVIDDAMMDFESGEPVAPNAAGLTFAEEQGSFLVGAAAALKSETGKIGFIGGVCCFGLIEKFEAGYRQGALAVNPDIEIVVQYITDAPDFDGFNQPDQAKVIATTMYEDGADIIYHAAGGAGNGMFAAAQEYSEDNGTKVWGIGVDSDQYNTIGTVDPALQEYVLTSMLKRVDTAVFEILKAQAEGTFAPGIQVYDLSVDGVGYSTSGGYVDDIVDQLDDFKAQIVAGDITVTADPTEVGG